MSTHTVQWQDVAVAVLVAVAAVVGVAVQVASWLVNTGRANGEKQGAVVASILPTGTGPRNKQAR